MNVQSIRGAMTLQPANQQRLRRIGTAIFFIAIAALLIVFAQRVDWPQVYQALRAYESSTLWLAAGITLISYGVYSTFDLLGRHYTGHRLPIPLVMTIGFVCYAFTQTLTAWVGGIAMRFRLYSRYGLQKGDITQIFSISILTNWIGYLLLASIVCALGFVRPPENWPVGMQTFRIGGALLMLPVLIYLWLCYRLPHHSRQWLGQEWQVPPLGIGLLQITGGAVNWACMAGVIFVLLRGQVEYPTVLGILLLSSVAAVIVHIPAGLGVLETLFVTLLSDVDRHQVIAALVGYRAIYYLIPLLVALSIYVVLEMHAKRSGTEAAH
jgi:uncharacterized membrane protein YbhN (UPF0104 family)